jgi:hypothetical protein
MYTSESDQIMRYTDQAGYFLDLCLDVDPDFVRRVKFKSCVNGRLISVPCRVSRQTRVCQTRTGSTRVRIMKLPRMLCSLHPSPPPELELGLELDSAEVRGILVYEGQDWGSVVFDFLS